MSVPVHLSEQLSGIKYNSSPKPGTIRQRQSMSTSGLTENDQLELSTPQSTTIDELKNPSGFYHTEDDSENEINSRTPMIMNENDNYRSNQLPARDKFCYWRIFVTSQVIAFLVFICLLYFIFGHLGGFSFSNPSVTFNFHPFFMVVAFILLYSHSILIYRTFRTEGKPTLKLIHAGLNFGAIVLGLCGSSAVYYFHTKAAIPHFYSLHSWLGILTWFFFTSQFVSGFVAFLFPGVSFTFRSLMMPFHRFCGVGTFLTAAATCLTGINEKAIFSIKEPPYSQLPSGGVAANLLGIFIVAYVSVIVYLVTKPEYKRTERPEEQVTHLNFDLTEN